MKLNRDEADIFVPDGASMPEALARTTHLCVGAHQDDQEFMAYHGIAECFGQADRWFTGVCLTNGSGSPRSGVYARYTDEDMMAVRLREQRKAAMAGEYACEIQLGYSSADVKDPSKTEVTEDLRRIFSAAGPDVVYLHNPADKHDTHVAAMLRAIAALRLLRKEDIPGKVYGCEIWRSLDWVLDEEKEALPVDTHPNLSESLAGIFDSQITGGKRYDRAIIGRRKSNATFFESHATDKYDSLHWAIDLTPLVLDPKLDPAEYALGFINRLAKDVETRIAKAGGA